MSLPRRRLFVILAPSVALLIFFLVPAVPIKVAGEPYFVRYGYESPSCAAIGMGDGFIQGFSFEFVCPQSLEFSCKPTSDGGEECGLMPVPATIIW